jgi:hypothetical protein
MQRPGEEMPNECLLQVRRFALRGEEQSWRVKDERVNSQGIQTPTLF